MKSFKEKYIIFKTILLLIIPNIYGQELVTLSNINKSSFILSASTKNDFGLSSNSSREIKINYKLKHPVFFFASALDNNGNDYSVNRVGFGYTISKKKFGVALFINKNYYYVYNGSLESDRINSLNLGWILNFKNRLNMFIKYNKSFDKHDFLTIKYDSLSFGGITKIKKIIFGYEIMFSPRDFLNFDLNNGIASLFVGYKL